MPLIDDFDSLDEEEPFEIQHALSGLNSRLIANGMDGFLESGVVFFLHSITVAVLLT